MVMSFSVEEAREQLLTEGYVFSFRRHKRKMVGDDWANTGRGTPKICDIVVNLLMEISYARDLKPFVHGSGFKSLTDWVVAIILLHKINDLHGYLYLARKLGRQP